MPKKRNIEVIIKMSGSPIICYILRGLTFYCCTKNRQTFETVWLILCMIYCSTYQYIPNINIYIYTKQLEKDVNTNWVMFSLFSLGCLVSDMCHVHVQTMIRCGNPIDQCPAGRVKLDILQKPWTHCEKKYTLSF